MPELPEVHTTATILNSLIKGKLISNIWSDYKSPYFIGKDNIKDLEYFLKFSKHVACKRIKKVWRRAKFVLIELEDNSTIVIHMKMTGHLLFGEFTFDKKLNMWKANQPGPLQDPFNRFIHLVFTFSDNTHVAFSDMRKFASVFFTKNKTELHKKFLKLGVEPLDTSFSSNIFMKRLTQKPNQKIKTALMNQELVVGIGNIYSDEILWACKINPERTVLSITKYEWKLLTKYTKNILKSGINFGGDSMSDYRNPYGLPGEFQSKHNAYRRTNKNCLRKKCEGKVIRKVINGRSAHYCEMCQK
jgi:formamidopyrimidine-DNA glycosylase